MKLNHINLPVADVAAARDFFARHFGFATRFELPRNTMAMMEDEGGMVLIISHFSKDEAPVEYHPDFHVGFILDDVGQVDATHARLTAEGIAAPVAKHFPGRYGFYIDAPGGFIVEVATLERPPRGARATPKAAELGQPLATD